MYIAKYKCRLCGKEYESVITGEVLARRCMYQTVYGIKSGEPLCPTIYEMHHCDNGSFGISDFLGFKKEIKEECTK